MSTYDEHAGDDRVGDERGDAAAVPVDAGTDGIAHDDFVSDDLVGDGPGREDLEGEYTDVEGKGPHVRTVHGQYTETAENPGPEPVTEGSYVDRDGVEQVLTVDEQGDYTETDTETRRRKRSDTERNEDV
jgi:hypothetical protein